MQRKNNKFENETVTGLCLLTPPMPGMSGLLLLPPPEGPGGPGGPGGPRGPMMKGGFFSMSLSV